jgi:amino acid transporter
MTTDPWSEDSSSWGGAATTYESTNVKKPPYWPLILQILLVLVSVGIFFTAEPEKYFSTSLLCYVLTPFLTVAALAVLRAIDLSNRSLEHYDSSLGRDYIKYASIISIVSFVFSLSVIFRFATEIAQLWGTR